ncbi:MAG: ATPase, T2SS/T4P/T4SS family [Myxococcota bacterium]|nr:ATPase, T2SS/T4P/T4SS family [Myxococcota bacterium]MDW8363781.1 ATPase, T2SS/T4P/T4SS family [Myxococcales bacterium]
MQPAVAQESLLIAVELGDGSVERMQVPLSGGPLYVGRDAGCHVVLPSPDVSRRHVALEPDPSGRIRLTDRSANGTFVGPQQQRVHNATVLVGYDVPFRVGPYLLRVLPPTVEPSSPVARPGLVRPPRGPARSGATHSGLEPTHVPEATAGPVATTSATPQGAARSSKYGQSGTAAVDVATRRRIHRALLDHLDLASLDRSKMDERLMRPRVREALTRICRQVELPAGTDLAALVEELTHEALGLGPLEVLLADDTVSEIMVVDPQTIFIEREGRIERTDLRFTDDDAVRACIERIVTPLGRRIDESTPLVDARLKDGSRVNAVIPPLALRGPCITIRKFKKTPLTIDDLIRYGALTERMAKFLARSVACRKNIVISGGTGSGKTTLLNVLSSFIPEHERIVTIEDAAELRLRQPHVVSLESRPPNMEGRGEVTIRDLVRNALRMRPDRIVVGECRGGEALDMLQAMNTGHEGSMTTTHANSPAEAIARLETLALMSGIDLPSRAIREQIAASVHLIVQQTRLSDGSRRITAISEVDGIDEHGEVRTRDIFVFARTGTGPDGRVEGEHRATGYLPTFLDDFIKHGLVRRGDYL